MHSADHVFQRPGKHALSRDRSCTGARSLASASVFSRAVKRQQATAWMPRSSVRVLAMQSGWNPQPRQQPQQPQPVANRQPAPLARTPAYQAAPVFLELTQVCIAIPHVLRTQTSVEVQPRTRRSSTVDSLLCFLNTHLSAYWGSNASSEAP